MGRKEELLAKLQDIRAKKSSGGLIPTSMRMGNVTYRNPDYLTTSQVNAQKGKEAQKALKNRTKVEDQLLQSLNLWGRYADWNKQHFGPFGDPGRVGGALGWMAGKAGANPYYEPFIGDQAETATSIAKIAAPSAKVGPDLIKIFGNTLMKGYSTFDEARNQVVSSLANSMYEEAATSGQQIDVDSARTQAEQIVDSYIINHPEIFKRISPDSYREKFGV